MSKPETWPIPGAAGRRMPRSPAAGSFWEDRRDRRHAGVDLYAGQGEPVLAAEAGLVIEVSRFTGPDLIPYWNVTWSVLLEHADGSVSRYAEMADTCVTPGQRVRAGQQIGRVGEVLNLSLIDSSSPLYIQRLKTTGCPAMLHFERYSSRPAPSQNYLGGNYFKGERPANLQDPTPYFAGLEDPEA